MCTTAKQIVAQCNGKWFGSYGSIKCPAHADSNPSLLVSESADGQVYFNCLAGCDFKVIKDHFNTELPQLCNFKPKDNNSNEIVRNEQYRANKALKIFQQAQPIKNTLGEEYFRNRGIAIDLPESLKFHPNLSHYQGGSYPAIIANVIGTNLNLPAIHCIYLNNDGTKLTTTDESNSPKIAKISIGAVAGGAVLIQSKQSKECIVAEGIENALSSIEYMNTKNISVIAAITTSGMRNLNLDYHTKGKYNTLWLAIDNDEAGIKAASSLIERARKKNIKAITLPLPYKNKDFNDMLLMNKQGTPTTTQEMWAPIIRLGKPLRDVLPMTEKDVPTPIFNYCQNIADRLNCPIEYPIITTMCALAATIGAGVRIKPAADSLWLSVPNLWGLLIGDPAAAKTPALKEALMPLTELDARLAGKQTPVDDYIKQQLIETKKAEINAAIKELSKRKGKINYYSDQYNIIRADVETLFKMSKKNTEQQRIVVQDATIEKLIEIMSNNPRGILLARDEMAGLLAKLNNQSGQTERAIYLQAHNGDEPFVQDRIGRGSTKVTTLTLSMIGTIQPSKYIPLLQQAITDVANDGLIERFQLTVYPDKPQTHNHTAKVDTAARQEFYKLFDIFDCKQLDTKSPLILTLNAEAAQIFVDWNQKLHSLINTPHTPETVAVYLSKMKRTLLSIAAIYHSIESFSNHKYISEEISADSLNMAINFSNILISHVKRCYVASSNDSKHIAREILRIRHLLPHKFNARDVHANGAGKTISLDNAERGIIALTHLNYARECVSDTGKAIKYEIRPDVPQHPNDW